tara:strand:+ start:110916 stop:112097 length:1182 start_codon:yes stop_codon:yes gene_type:complete
MGSGFLVSAPLLAAVVGNWSPLVMAGLLLVAWLVGDAVRFNIRYAEPLAEHPSKAMVAVDASFDASNHRLHRSHRDAAALKVKAPELISHFILAVAYFISTTYYVQLLSEFSLGYFGVDSEMVSKVVSSGVLFSIAMIGFLFGLSIIEKVERYAINLNLAMIGALIACLIWHNLALWIGGDWILPDLQPEPDKWHAARVCLGLLVVVQGFETSRFLGSDHSAKVRVTTMKWAQAVAAAVYLIFLTLILVVMTPEQASASAGVTAIVSLAGSLAVVLPAMITIAAIGSQFSASVADEAGCGGLLSSLTSGGLTSRSAYLAIGCVTVGLAWTVDVMQVIAIASRAFAAFYCLQCWVAATIAWTGKCGAPRRVRAVGYGLLTIGCLAITVLGIPSE